MNKKILITFCTILSFGSFLYANEDNRRGEPPKEAIEVCKGQDIGYKCTMNTPRGSLSGQCKNTPDNKYLACMPEGGPDNARPQKP